MSEWPAGTYLAFSWTLLSVWCALFSKDSCGRGMALDMVWWLELWNDEESIRKVWWWGCQNGIRDAGELLFMISVCYPLSNKLDSASLSRYLSQVAGVMLFRHPANSNGFISQINPSKVQSLRYLIVSGAMDQYSCFVIWKQGDLRRFYAIILVTSEKQCLHLKNIWYIVI